MAEIILESTSERSIHVYVGGMSSTYGYRRQYEWNAYRYSDSRRVGGTTEVDAYVGLTESAMVKFSDLSAGTKYEINCRISGYDTGTYIDTLTTYVWTDDPTYYTLTLHRGEGISSVSGGDSVEAGETLDISATVSSGYTFDGWYDGSGTFYGSSTSLSVDVYEDMDLYARASVSTTTLTLSYSANGGSGAPSSQSQSVNVGSNATFTISGTVPTRTGYTFQGWSTSSGAGSASYSPNGSITIASNITLYAVWSLNTYTVSYNANGGSGAPGSQTKTYGQTLTLSSVSPTRAGYRFKGWATSGAATTATYQPGGSYTQNAGLSLYAVWQEVAYYGVDGAWRPAVLYYGVDGVWVEASAYVGSSGAWKNAE